MYRLPAHAGWMLFGVEEVGDEDGFTLQQVDYQISARRKAAMPFSTMGQVSYRATFSRGINEA
jgi:hypothetical protein